MRPEGFGGSAMGCGNSAEAASKQLGTIERAKQNYDECRSESLRSRVIRKVNEATSEAVRHERLAEKLTPEIEAALWCWQEAMALGLIDGRVLADNINKLERSGRDRF